MGYREERAAIEAADAAAPASDRLIHAGAMAEILAFEEATWCLFNGYAADPHWLHHDEHGDDDGTYCHECACERMAELDREDGWTPEKEEADGDEGWMVNGGGGESESGPKSCDTCGRAVNYHLDDSTAGDELRYLDEERPDDRMNRVDDAHATTELVQWARHLGPSRVADVETVARIVATFDLERLKVDVPAEIARLDAAEAVKTRARHAREAEEHAARRRAWAKRMEEEKTGLAA